MSWSVQTTGANRRQSVSSSSDHPAVTALCRLCRLMTSGRRRSNVFAKRCSVPGAKNACADRDTVPVRNRIGIANRDPILSVPSPRDTMRKTSWPARTRPSASRVAAMAAPPVDSRSETMTMRIALPEDARGAVEPEEPRPLEDVLLDVPVGLEVRLNARRMLEREDDRLRRHALESAAPPR